MPRLMKIKEEIIIMKHRNLKVEPTKFMLIPLSGEPPAAAVPQEQGGRVSKAEGRILPMVSC